MPIARTDQTKTRTLGHTLGIKAQRQVILRRHARHVHRRWLKIILQLPTPCPVIQRRIRKQLTPLLASLFNKGGASLFSVLCALSRCRIVTTCLRDHRRLLATRCEIGSHLRAVTLARASLADALEIFEHL